jgi:hypothetical protein
MQDYEFEVTIVAVARVRAESEDRAREVVASSALGCASLTVFNADGPRPWSAHRC